MQDGVTAFQHADAEPAQLVVTNAVEYRGRFTRNDGCLELVSDGARYTPIFNNVEHLRTAVRESGTPAKSALWSIAGGPTGDRLSVAASVLGSCQRSLFVVVGISDPRSVPST